RPVHPPLDRRQRLAVGALDLHGVAHAHHLLLDLGELLPLRALKDQRLPDAQGFAIDLVDALATVILDPKVVADRDQLLAHLIAGRVATSAKRRPLFLPLLSSLFSPLSHPLPLIPPSWPSIRHPTHRRDRALHRARTSSGWCGPTES